VFAGNGIGIDEFAEGFEVMGLGEVVTAEGFVVDFVAISVDVGGDVVGLLVEGTVGIVGVGGSV
jgi:hypothetical protein